MSMLLLPFLQLLLASCGVLSQGQSQTTYSTSRMCLNTTVTPPASVHQFAASSAMSCAARCQQVSVSVLAQWHFTIATRWCSCSTQPAPSYPSDGCISWSRQSDLQMVGYWPMKSPMGLANQGSLGSLLDGSQVNGSQLTVDSEGVRFSGAKTDERINASGARTVNLTAFTFMAWLRPDSGSKRLPMWESGMQNGDYRSGIWFHPDMSHLYTFTLNSQGNLKTYNLALSPVLNSWNFLAVVYNPSTVNNALCATLNLTTPVCTGIGVKLVPNMASGSEFWLGGVPLIRTEDVSPMYVGRMKCFGLSTKALSQAELQEVAAMCESRLRR